MDYQQIESFLAIAKTKSMNRAAELLYISQPTLTYRLRKLEQELGYQLFIRKKGQHITFLTPEGSTFLPIAERWKAAFDETNVFKVSGANTQIRIASTSSLNAFAFPNLYYKLRSFADSLDIRSYHSYEIYSKVSIQELDIGFVFHESQFQDMQTVPLFSEKMRFICNGKEFDDQLTIHPINLHPSNEIFTDWGMEYRQWHKYWFGESAHPYVHLDSIPLMEHFFLSESSWTFIPDSVLASMPKLNKYVRSLSAPYPPDRVCHMVTNAHHPIRDFRWGNQFLDALNEFLATSPWLTDLYHAQDKTPYIK
ncbi:MAG: LysR family transcriptional regulator [Clostridiales bacterium]|nr:LysR family transcriptional regulator [Clostridiales bacterium]